MHQCSLPDHIVEDIITIAWSQRHMSRRWQFYRALLCLCPQWQAILRYVSLRFIVLESPKDVRNYFRLILNLKAAISDKDTLENFFSKTHIRADVAALGSLSPIFPACRSLEFTGQVGFRPRRPSNRVRLGSWLRIPGLTSVAFVHCFMFRGLDPRPINPPVPTLTQIHYHHQNAGYYNILPPPWLIPWLGSVTHLRVSSPRSLFYFVKHVPKLEELTLDIADFNVFSYTIVAALKAGLIRGPRKKLILNTGLNEPSCYPSVAATCQRLGISLERNIVELDNQTLASNVSFGVYLPKCDCSNSQLLQNGVPTFIIPWNVRH